MASQYGPRARKRVCLERIERDEDSPPPSPPELPLSRLVLLNKQVSGQAANRADRAPFSIITALCSNMDILLNVVQFIPPRSLVFLYSISAPFYYMMNSHFTSCILACTKGWAKGAEWFFPWRCYRELCIDDPAMRRPKTKSRKVVFMDRVTGQRRTSDEYKDQTTTSKANTSAPISAVPSLRWLKMVVYREIVTREIVGWLAVGGHRTPVGLTADALKRMWFLMDIPLNAPRIALIHNTAYFPNQVLGVLMLFVIKLDMFWTDPINFNGGEGILTDLLLAERSLTTLWNYLRRVDGTNRAEVLRLWVKHSYQREPRIRPETEQEQQQAEQREKEPIMGIPPHMVGRFGHEVWGLGAQKLLRPDELVLREQIRRGLDLQKQWLRMMRWGYLDNNLKTMPPVKADEVVWSLAVRKRNAEQAERARKSKEAERGEVEMESLGEELDVGVKVEPMEDVLVA